MDNAIKGYLPPGPSFLDTLDLQEHLRFRLVRAVHRGEVDAAEVPGDRLLGYVELERPHQGREDDLWLSGQYFHSSILVVNTHSFPAAKT